MMKILVIGNGGREHALVWKLANDSGRPQVFCAPGNAGTAEMATNLELAAEDLDGIVRWSVENRPDLVVVGPEAPLCAGVTDRLEQEGLRVFGPSRAAAQLEGSKIFAKEVMQSAGVPTAAAWIFSDVAAARAHLASAAFPLVIKADGLAAGKGVYVCAGPDQAEQAVHEILEDRVFGAAGNRILVEECLQGEEASILALIDGERIVMLASSQDHKRVFNNDEGPNTGGMGAYSPAPVVTEDLWPVIREQVFERTLVELKRRGIVYKGVLYAGLMMTESGPKVLEFNCRFGDPETQVILPRIDGDLAPALMACAEGKLDDRMIAWRKEACVCVVMASGGYPGTYETGKIIGGLKDAGELEGVVVFHAGTREEGGKILTSGGRVLGVTTLGDDLSGAVRRAYRAILKIKYIDFDEPL